MIIFSLQLVSKAGIYVCRGGLYSRLATIEVSDLVRYVFKTTNLGKKDLGVPQLLNKRYIRERTQFGVTGQVLGRSDAGSAYLVLVVVVVLLVES
jgi:hypothetical protein